jgi:ectoine hydroxylase-related dioxygenase (phytanoyl-CoA dioxygenase family)
MSEDFSNKILIHDYDQASFPFRTIFADFVADALGCETLEELHRHLPPVDELLRVREDQKTYGHHVLYKIDPRFRPTDLSLDYEVRDRGFISTYQAFVAELERKVFAEKLVYQTLPTLRIHLPNNLSVGEYHRDRQYDHPVEEVNVWVPVTRATGTATIHIEPAPYLGGHRPVEAGPGRFVIFDSGLEHGNEVNREGYTRISFDFRVIPESRYKESAGASANEQKAFRVGGYYSRL